MSALSRIKATPKSRSEAPVVTGMEYPKSRADEYREQAAQTRRDADGMIDPTLRKQLLDIADEFEKLADSLERARFGYAALALAGACICTFLRSLGFGFAALAARRTTSATRVCAEPNGRGERGEDYSRWRWTSRSPSQMSNPALAEDLENGAVEIRHPELMPQNDNPVQEDRSPARPARSRESDC